MNNCIAAINAREILDSRGASDRRGRMCIEDRRPTSAEMVNGYQSLVQCHPPVLLEYR